MTVLTFLSYYLPGYKGGGPIRTIENMANSLYNKVNFHIITRDHDLGSSTPYYNIEYKNWVRVNNTQVKYLSNSMYNYKHLKQLIFETSHNVLYLNSFFSFYDSILPLLIITFNKKYDKKIILAPRGEFSKGALKINSFRKFAFIIIAKLFSLHKNVTWQASSKFEQEDIYNIFKKAKKIIIAPDLTYTPTSNYIEEQKIKINHYSVDNKTLNTVFYSRICEKKNLFYLIDILSNIKRNLNLDIYGPIEDQKYWKKCETLIKSLPQNITCNYKGIIKPENVTNCLINYDLFLFPTLGENFGHVIFESLLSGTPLFISDQTPWGHVESQDILNVIPLEDKIKWINSIENFNTSRIINLKFKTLIYAWEYSQNNDIIDMNMKLIYD